MPHSSSASSSDDEERVEHLQFKLVLLGGQAVGKTAIARRLAHGGFDSKYTPTVGVEFYKAELSLADDIHTTLQVWDIGSNISSLSMAANYLQGCDAVLAVHDITRQETFDHTCQWLGLLQQMFQQSALPYVAVVANKADTDALQAAAAQLHSATASTGNLYSYCMSAKTGTNIKSTFHIVAADLAGIPLTQQQLQQQVHAALDRPQLLPQHSTSEGSSSSSKQAQVPPSKLLQPTVVLPPLPAGGGPLSPGVATATGSSPLQQISSGLRSRRGLACQASVSLQADAVASETCPQQQVVSRSSGEPASEAEPTLVETQTLSLQTCRCCCFPTLRFT